MKIKKEYLILVVLIIVLSLYLVFYKADKTKYQLPVIPDIAKNDISKIELSTSGDAIVITKKDDSWRISPEGYLADDKKVKSMLDVIEGLALTDLVSESKSYVRYDLSDEKKITVNAYVGGSPALTFDIGKTAPSFRHTFVRLKGDPRVFYAGDNFRSKFEQTVDKLRDKKVLDFDKNDIQALAILKGDQALTLTKEQVPVTVDVAAEENKDAPPETELAWLNKDGDKIEESKITRLLSTLSRLNCSAYMDGTKKEDLKEAIYSVTLKGADEYSLSVYAKKEKDANEYPAVSSQSEYVFSLTASQADNFMSIFDEKKE